MKKRSCLWENRGIDDISCDSRMKSLSDESLKTAIV